VNGATPSKGGLTGQVCGKDANNDGQLSAGEFRPCVTGVKGSLCPIDAVDCQPGPVCPLGNFPCVQNRAKFQCSPLTCSDVEDANADTGAYQDDGSRDQVTGQCQGQIYIFNGKGGECKEPGVSTTWFQCCSTDEANFLFIEKACGTGDRLTSMAMKDERTHLVGTYCKKKFPLIGCVQTAQVHCVFESKLGRILQEQGRLQLKNFQDANGKPSWGTPEAPNCRGFTPEEFQFLDFGKMDLSEFFADIKTKATNIIQGEIKDKAQDYFNNTVK
jgi:conjugal transfer mating pair stabilization protein TraN